MALKGYQQRVVDEKAALDAKIASLRNFITTNPKMKHISQAESLRMSNQLIAMKNYSFILGSRIQAFHED